MKSGLSDDDIRRRIASHLGSPITDDEWVLLEEEEYPNEIRNAIHDGKSPAEIKPYVQSAADHLRRVRRSQRGAEQRRGPRMRSPALRQALVRQKAFHAEVRDEELSDALAGLAEQDEEVQAFRRDYFGGRYIYDYYRPPSSMPYPAWIQHQWEQERFPAEQNGESLPVLSYARSLPSNPIDEDDEDSEYEYESVVYSLPVVPGGVLDRLRRIAERLAYLYRWDPAGAATFVLTGFAPSVSTLTTEVDWRDDLSVMTRIVLTIDPRLTPKQVADAYQRERKKLIVKFPREMDLKSLHLASRAQSKIFAGRTLAEQMMEWNLTARDEWRYSNVHAFGRDRRRAVQRLLHPRYRRPAYDVNDN